jgi:hypothetical protein
VADEANNAAEGDDPLEDGEDLLYDLSYHPNSLLKYF